MGFFEFFGLATIIFFVSYVLLWLLLDCNVILWFYGKFSPSISSMHGKVVWITGASSGIGRALALNLARHGVRLVLSARRLENLKDVKNECLKESKGQLADDDVLVLQMDVLETGKHKDHLEAVIKHFKRLDILVNNAGRSQRASWEEIEVQVDRDLFELDVFAVMHLSRLVVRYFLRENNGRGHVAATSSVAGLGIVPFSATYCAAKHALNAYLNALRVEHPGIEVTIFAPGPIATEFLQEAFTAVPDVKVGQSTKNQKRMSADRCGYLFAVALANKIDLSWCGLFPVNFLAYAMQNYVLSRILFLAMGRKTMSKIREGKI